MIPTRLFTAGTFVFVVHAAATNALPRVVEVALDQPEGHPKIREEHLPDADILTRYCVVIMSSIEIMKVKLCYIL